MIKIWEKIQDSLWLAIIFIVFSCYRVIEWLAFRDVDDDEDEKQIY